ncbi:hypothetical protein [Delftia acidovorans]|uniref:hypothetical protein n=1 Tax=Delftia acidovorans TaxID=80866 RepID=UPI00286EBA6E|nr:hypothetical protein [Delftia acidovorans]
MDEVQRAQVLRAWKENIAKPIWRDAISIVAQEKFAKFQAYRAAGFDAKQALELVIREGDQ